MPHEWDEVSLCSKGRRITLWRGHTSQTLLSLLPSGVPHDRAARTVPDSSTTLSCPENSNTYVEPNLQAVFQTFFSRSQRDKLRQAFRESACQIQGSTQEQSCSSLLRVCLKLCLTFRTKEAIHRAGYREFLHYNSSIWYTIFIKNSTFYLIASPTY